ncbi:alpha/beta hydrolase [Aspergillus affinis]|uniref:alpha/beta hydrolase n=1 Tax=Aspergillus affinis TaxID=1070780 RepID=UPI0022FDE5CC|nr:dihydrofolate reductase [Aspergillus affinis]KAI9039159.1 dihydrofolate reductase [Aspergillus affinis]
MPPQPLKLLMLHGYTQSGPLFHAKSRALIKHITKAFSASHEVAAIYPTGPIRLDPADIPGYEPPTTNEEHPTPEAPEAYGWFRRSNTANPPLYMGLEDGLAAVARVLKEEGPFDGVIGFSQGAAMAAMVASLLEGNVRKEAFGKAKAKGLGDASDGDKEGVFGYPASFEGLVHPPLKFAICYSGFRSPGARYRGFYEEPGVQTPMLHVLGTLDAVVEESRSRSLIEACVGDPEAEGKVVWHPGGHFLPSQRPYLDAAVRFVRESVEEKKGKASEEEEDVNDMDLPF